MPSFVCDHCQETLKKAKLDQHAQRCRQAAFSCIDCYKNFKGVEYREHFTCITEVQKYHQKTPVAPPKAAAKPEKIEPSKPEKQTAKPEKQAAKPEKKDQSKKSLEPVDSELTAAIKQILKSNPSADLKVVKKQLKKSLGKKSKKALQEKIVFSLDKETKELIVKLDN